MADAFNFESHRHCEIGTIGRTIKSYKVEQIQNEAGESSEDFSDGEGEYEDGQERSNHSSNSAYGHEYDMGSGSSQSYKEDGKQDSDD